MGAKDPPVTGVCTLARDTSHADFVSSIRWDTPDPVVTGVAMEKGHRLVDILVPRMIITAMGEALIILPPTQWINVGKCSSL